jgi:hypothetical protein
LASAANWPFVIRLNAAGRQDQLLRLGIYRRFGSEGLRFEVVEHGAFGIDGDGLLGGGQLRVGVAGLEEEDGFVTEVEWAPARDWTERQCQRLPAPP